MKPSTTTTRLLALFVVAFLCLNAGAFLCLAYCGRAMAATTESCPLKKAGAHCPHSQTADKNKDDASFAGNSVTCCMLPVGVFGVPIETKGGMITAAPLAAVVEKTEFAPVVLDTSRQSPKLYYRPPPNDARVNRVRNQVFRI